MLRPLNEFGSLSIRGKYAPVTHGLTLFLGGTSSGKSAWEKNYVLSFRKKPVYITTVQAYDDEMIEKATSNKKRRSSNCRTFEELLALVDRLTKLGQKFQSDQGHLNQKLAGIGDCVILITAHLPMLIRGTLPEDMT